MSIKLIKNALRGNLLLEIAAYLLHNNIFHKYFNFSGEGSFDTSVEGLYRHGVRIADQYLMGTPQSLRGKRILEIGCGLTLSSAYYLVKEAGAEHVFTYDRFFSRHINDEAVLNKYGLAEYSNRVSYITGDYRALEATIAPSSIDYVYSNAVLEHVADPEALFAVLGKVLALDGAMLHRVDLRCHNRFRRHGELYFHTFSPRLWRAMGHNIGHPNRWLLSDYKRLFESLGYSVSIKQTQTFSKNVLDDAKCYIPNLCDQTLNEYETAVFDADLKWTSAKSDLR